MEAIVILLYSIAIMAVAFVGSKEPPAGKRRNWIENLPATVDSDPPS
jgi:hypothetical protein